MNSTHIKCTHCQHEPFQSRISALFDLINKTHEDMSSNPAQTSEMFLEQVAAAAHLQKAHDKESDEYINYLNAGVLMPCGIVLSFLFDASDLLHKMDMSLRSRALVLKVSTSLSFTRIVNKQINPKNLN